MRGALRSGELEFSFECCGIPSWDPRNQRTYRPVREDASQINFGMRAIVGSSLMPRKLFLRLAGEGRRLLLNHLGDFIQQFISSIGFPQNGFDADTFGLFDILLRT